MKVKEDTTASVASYKVRRPGELFQEIVGQSVTDLQSIQDVEHAVEKRLGHRLASRRYESDLIPGRGDVFSHRDVDLKQIDAEIDKYLHRI